MAAYLRTVEATEATWYENTKSMLPHATIYDDSAKSNILDHCLIGTERFSRRDPQEDLNQRSGAWYCDACKKFHVASTWWKVSTEDTC